LQGGTGPADYLKAPPLAYGGLGRLGLVGLARANGNAEAGFGLGSGLGLRFGAGTERNAEGTMAKVLTIAKAVAEIVEHDLILQSLLTYQRLLPLGYVIEGISLFLFGNIKSI